MIDQNFSNVLLILISSLPIIAQKGFSTQNVLMDISFYVRKKPFIQVSYSIYKQAGAELCQAQHSLGWLPLAWSYPV